eukprot:GHRR01016859.1.p1 GENE.GHRR01016859.1~~GHRR01016859.1.p1  ORF type:complete len:181 (+),score=49.99 GHRR01016859.1:556-1098(+)
MYPPYGPLTAERLQQVEELVRQFPGCRAINPDRSVFDLPLELKDKKTTALRISLPPHFPQERPMLSVIIPVVHPNVDPNGRVHTSLLNNWVYGISRLESVVAEAVSALTEGVTDSRQPGTVPFPAGYPVPLGGLGQARTGSPSPMAATHVSTGSANVSPARPQRGAAGPATSSTLPNFSR